MSYILGVPSLSSESFLISEIPEASSDDEALYEFFEDDSQTESFIPTNPFELMERLRRSTALDNATAPSDAIDDALKDFEGVSDDRK